MDHGELPRGTRAVTVGQAAQLAGYGLRRMYELVRRGRVLARRVGGARGSWRVYVDGAGVPLDGPDAVAA